MTDAPAPATEQPAEHHNFGAEVGRLLDLVVHSLYSEREIFLRELVANAADATDRRRFLGLSDAALAPPENARIRVIPDKAARTLTIEDDGVGMTRADLIANLGTIARSGTRAFGDALAETPPEDRPTLIGQFGVGFYAAFMVAERVIVVSRPVGTDHAMAWESAGRGEFTLRDSSRETAGTSVILHLKSDAEEYLEPYRLETILRKWADHIAWPVVVLHDGTEIPATEGTALWRRPKAEITDAQYEAFFRHLGHFLGKPWLTLHWRAEGAMEFSALLFIPDTRPIQPLEDQRDSRLRLHVRRMFITNEAGLLPPWLRFVDGVVDTEDLPLNVSREMLQATPVLARIRRAVTNRVLTELKARARDADSAYLQFWENFGHILKEGAWEDPDHRADLGALMRFRSSTADGWTGLDSYVARMRPGQEAIYYLVGDDLDALRHSPQLEGFTARGVEVLLMADSIDSFWPDRFGTHDGKPLRAVGAAAADLAALPPPASPPGPLAEVSGLLGALRAALEPHVSDVRATDRLVESAVVLAPADTGASLHRQRLLRRAGRAASDRAPVLEINPASPVIAHLAAEQAAGHDILPAARLLLDLARIQEGDLPADPAGFARAVTRFLAPLDPP